MCVGILALGLFGGVLVHTSATPVVQQLMAAVRARCVASIGAIIQRIDLWFMFALGIPAALFFLFAGSFLFQFLATRRFRRGLCRVPVAAEPPHLVRLRRQLRLVPAGLVVFQSPFAVCFCAGFFRPCMYVSTSAIQQLEERELRTVIIHERHHLIHRDPLRVALLNALQRALFFLPVIRILRQRYVVSQEVAADAPALSIPGGSLALVSALYKLSAAAHPRVAAAAFARQEEVTARVALLSGQSVAVTPLPIVHIMMSVIAMAGLALVLTAPTQARVTVPPIDCPGFDGPAATLSSALGFPMSPAPRVSLAALAVQQPLACAKPEC